MPRNFKLEKDFFVAFELHDAKTKENLLQIASVYQRSATMVFNEEGDTLFPGPAPGDGLILFPPLLPEEEFPLDTPVIQHFYLQLKKPSSSLIDMDTFRLEYQVYLDEDCNEKAFTYLNFYYNEELVFEKTDWSRGLYVVLYK